MALVRHATCVLLAVTEHVQLVPFADDLDADIEPRWLQQGISDALGDAFHKLRLENRTVRYREALKMSIVLLGSTFYPNESRDKVLLEELAHPSKEPIGNVPYETWWCDIISFASSWFRGQQSRFTFLHHYRDREILKRVAILVYSTLSKH